MLENENMIKFKTLILTSLALSVGGVSLAQTNTFPNIGKVGIGTASPTEQVSIFGTINSLPGVISLESSRNDAVNVEVGAIKVKNDNVEVARIGVLRSGGTHSGMINFNVKEYNSTLVEAMRISDNGNVGIGTTTPGYLLHLRRQQPTMNFEKAGVLNWVVGNVSGNDFYIRADNAASSPFMIESGTGNVGVGTANPKEKLEVLGQVNSYNVGIGQQDIGTSTKNFANFSSNSHGSVLISSNLYVSGNDDLKTAKEHPSLSGAAILIPGNGRVNQGGMYFFTSTPAPVIVDQGFTANPAMALTASGDLGIGTSSPKEKLSVNGKIRAKEVKVEVANWPDYVFEDSYRPKTPSEIESFVKLNKHLPDVPSAKQVEANGIELGEMNKVLLKKIEELTLLLIEQNKRIEKLEKNK